MFQPGIQGACNPQMIYRPPAVPLFEFNKNQYPNQFQNRVPHGSSPRFQQHHYQPTAQPNAVHGDRNRFQPLSEWPSLSEAKFKKRQGGPTNPPQKGGRDVEDPDLFWSKLTDEQNEEKQQLYKLFYQVLRDNGPMDVCNQRILSTFMSLPESQRRIILKVGGIQRFFLKSPMFVLQGETVRLAEQRSNSSSPIPSPSGEENICPRNGPYRCPIEPRTDATNVTDTQAEPNVVDLDSQNTSQTQTPTKPGLDVQAQPFSPQMPASRKRTKSVPSTSPAESTSLARNNSEGDADDILLDLNKGLDKIQINDENDEEIALLDKSADDCHVAFTEKAKLLGIDVRDASKSTDTKIDPDKPAAKQDLYEANNKTSQHPIPGGWRERRKSSDSRSLSPTTVEGQKTKKTDETKRVRQLEASVKQKLELELTQVKLNNMEHNTEQIERKAHMQLKIKDMDLKKMNVELTEAENQITALLAQNKNLLNRNCELNGNVIKLMKDKICLQDEINKMNLEGKYNDGGDEMTLRLKEALTRAREAEIKILENNYKECLLRIDKVVQKKESNFISMFSPEDNISVDTLWKEYISLVDVQKADLKEQYIKTLESLKMDVPLKDCPPLSEQDISVFVKQGRKEKVGKLEDQTCGVLEKQQGFDNIPVLNKQATFGNSSKEQKESPLKEQPTIPSSRHPLRKPSQMFPRNPTAIPKPPGLSLSGFSPFGANGPPQQPILIPHSTASTNNQSVHLLDSASYKNPIPVIRSPPFSSLANKGPTIAAVFNAEPVPTSFNFNTQPQDNKPPSMHRKYRQPVPFRQMSAPAIPSLAVPLNMPVLPTQHVTSMASVLVPLRQTSMINPTFSTTSIGSFATEKPYEFGKSFSPEGPFPHVLPEPSSKANHETNKMRMNKMPTSDENTIAGACKTLQQIKRKIDLNNAANFIPNLLDVSPGRNEVPPERISGEQLEISCGTFYVDLDETECWDDEDYTSTQLCSGSQNNILSPDQEPGKGVGYHFTDPAGGDTSANNVSDLVRTLQTWSQDIPGSFKVHKDGEVDCKPKTTQPQIVFGKNRSTDARPVGLLSPPEKQSQIFSEGISKVHVKPDVDIFCNASPPSYNEQEARRWQEVTKKKKRKVQAMPFSVKDMNKPQSSLDKIVYTLVMKLPNLERNEYIDSVKIVRDAHKGSLSGVPLAEIVDECCIYLHDRQKRKVLHEEENTICAVCHEDVDVEEDQKLECGHQYHSDCIKQWIHTRERTCPLCRKFILLPEDFPAL